MLSSELTTLIFLTGCIFVYKNFFYLESAGLWWEFVFFIFYFWLRGFFMGVYVVVLGAVGCRLGIVD